MTTLYLYDGWDVVAEIKVNSTASTLELLRTYAWAEHLSGTESGAGGVGGLLMTKREPNEPRQAALACADGNGHIVAWIDLGAATASAQVIGRQGYDPFGVKTGISLNA